MPVLVPRRRLTVPHRPAPPRPRCRRCGRPRRVALAAMGDYDVSGGGVLTPAASDVEVAGGGLTPSAPTDTEGSAGTCCCGDGGDVDVPCCAPGVASIPRNIQATVTASDGLNNCGVYLPAGVTVWLHYVSSGPSFWWAGLTGLGGGVSLVVFVVVSTGVGGGDRFSDLYFVLVTDACDPVAVMNNGPGAQPFLQAGRSTETGNDYCADPTPLLQHYPSVVVKMIGFTLGCNADNAGCHVDVVVTQ